MLDILIIAYSELAIRSLHTNQCINNKMYANKLFIKYLNTNIFLNNQTRLYERGNNHEFLIFTYFVRNSCLTY